MVYLLQMVDLSMAGYMANNFVSTKKMGFLKVWISPVWINNFLHGLAVDVLHHQLNILSTRPGKHTQFAIANGHRNSGFTH